MAERNKTVEVDPNRIQAIATAVERAKAKNARLRLMKARNENYLAERRDEPELDDALVEELDAL